MRRVERSRPHTFLTRGELVGFHARGEYPVFGPRSFLPQRAWGGELLRATGVRLQFEGTRTIVPPLP
jgi:hypothetical protein